MSDNDTESGHLSYGELLKRSESLAAILQLYAERGDRVIILSSDRREFIIALFASLLCGTIAVPVHPPKRNKVDHKNQAIVKDCNPKVVISNKKTYDQCINQNPHLEPLKCVFVDESPEITNTFVPGIISPEQTALIQYTSGSTGAPKGVVLTHANISANSKIIHKGMMLSEQTVHVTWLPQFHDMGLFGAILEPIFCGVHTVFVPPLEFIQKPVKWLKAMSQYKASISGAPSFGYDLCVEKIRQEDCEGLDLSNWKVAYCGSEMVRPDMLRDFGQKFAPYGFNLKAFYPCYGMAEASLMISGVNYLSGFQVLNIPEDETLDNKSREVVSCGSVGTGCTIKIMSAGKPCIEGQIGEIFYKGANVAQGYWQKPTESESAFNVNIEGESGFLKTGDLGFLMNKSLFVTGRKKDLIIKRGQNLYPHDIESIASRSHESLVKDAAFAYSINTNSQELLVMIQEVKRTAMRKLDGKAISEKISRQVTEDLDVQIDDIILVGERALPKTTSGKLMRRQAKSIYTEENDKSVLYRWKLPETSFQNDKLPPVATERGIQQLIQELLLNTMDSNSAEPALDTSIFELGIDSVAAVDLTVALEENLGISLDPSLLWEFQTIREIASFIHSQK